MVEYLLRLGRTSFLTELRINYSHYGIFINDGGIVIMINKIIVTSILAVLIISGIGGYYVYNEKANAPTPEEEKTAVAFVEEAFNDTDAIVEDASKIRDWKAQYPDDLEEYKMQNIIHNMSHQKVKAEERWGHSQITKGKTDRLLEIAKANVDNYEHEATYIEILEKWAINDFAGAVEDHNAIWGLQGGNVGEAYRLMTPVEEWDYIQENFIDKRK